MEPQVENSQRSVISPLPAVQLPSASNWKDHPVVVASMAVAGTVALAVLLVKELILPTHTAALTNQVASLSSEVSSLRAYKKEAEKKLAQIEAQVTQLDRRLFQAQHANLFSIGNPYPVGVGQIRVGDPISNIAAIYPEIAIKKNENGYWSIEDRHKIFSYITYYFDESQPKNPITHIRFSAAYSDEISDDFLQEKLIESFGGARHWKRKGFFSWKTSANVVVYKNDNKSYLVMQDDSRPGFWPDE